MEINLDIVEAPNEPQPEMEGGTSSPITMHEGRFIREEVKFLIYGDSGSGKTRFASSWPTPLFLDIDKGMSSVKKRIARWEINSWTDLERAIEFLEKGQHPYRTIVVDSLNELQHFNMKNVIENARPIWQIEWHKGIEFQYKDYPAFVETKDGGFDFNLFLELGYLIVDEHGFPTKISAMKKYSNYFFFPEEKKINFQFPIFL